MEIYQSELLHIEYVSELDMMIQNWSDHQLSPEDFQREALSYIDLLSKVKPRKVLWDHRNFSFQIPDPLFQWIEESINISGKNWGVDHLAFVLSRDLYHQITLLEPLKQKESAFHPHYFISREKAIHWLKVNPPEKADSPDFTENVYHYTIDVINSDEKSLAIKFEGNEQYVSGQLKKLMAEYDFVQRNRKKFLSLTKQQVKILMYLAKGYTNPLIAEAFFISIETVKTHRKNIKRKLEVKTDAALFEYARAFQLF